MNYNETSVFHFLNDLSRRENTVLLVFNLALIDQRIYIIRHVNFSVICQYALISCSIYSATASDLRRGLNCVHYEGVLSIVAVKGTC